MELAGGKRLKLPTSRIFLKCLLSLTRAMPFLINNNSVKLEVLLSSKLWINCQHLNTFSEITGQSILQSLYKLGNFTCLVEILIDRVQFVHVHGIVRVSIHPVLSE